MISVKSAEIVDCVHISSCNLTLPISFLQNMPRRQSRNELMSLITSLSEEQSLLPNYIFLAAGFLRYRRLRTLL